MTILYRLGMRTQIAVRLADDTISYLDRLVDMGEARSRAAAVRQALERDQRVRIAERDAVILADAPPDTDLDRLAEYAVQNEMPGLD